MASSNQPPTKFEVGHHPPARAPAATVLAGRRYRGQHRAACGSADPHACQPSEPGRDDRARDNRLLE